MKFLTGRPPQIFEPTNPADTGCYGSSSQIMDGSIGYGITGGWGTTQLPFQFFLKVYRPLLTGTALNNGWGDGAGGYGVGFAAYLSADNQLTPSDDLIRQSVIGSIPAGTLAWINITN